MNEIISQGLLLLLPVTALAVVFTKNLINALITYSILVLLLAVVIFQLKAPDVALSLLVVSSASLVIFLFAIHKTEVEE